MIKQISEINFPEYATLSQASVTFADMGERTISTTIKIDGDVVPDFTGWELRFKGERFVLPTRTPQALKDNSSRCSQVELNFESWVINELKRYFFFEPVSVASGTTIADKYNASVLMPVTSFVEIFNEVLDYYFDGKVVMLLHSGDYSSEPVSVELNKTYIWDVLAKWYETFSLRWRIQYDETLDQYQILVGYDDVSLEDHDFEYGYEGGLLKFERQVEDEDLKNILLGRGGEKNLPYRYFKRVDEQNPNWTADPDAIPELQNVYFDRLRDINFRNYVQGWRTNPHRDTSWEVVRPFNRARALTDWAYKKGHFDEKFDPVEYVKDDDSIAKYGERWGALDDNDDIYPTIQGIDLENDDPDIGRVDEIVDVSEILTDDIEAMAEAAITREDIPATLNVTMDFDSKEEHTETRYSDIFEVPAGKTANIEWVWMPNPIGPADYATRAYTSHSHSSSVGANNRRAGGTVKVTEVVLDTDISSVVAVNTQTGTELAPEGLPAGSYRLKLVYKAKNNSETKLVDVTFGLQSLRYVLADVVEDAWKPTFDIWIKDIWQTKDSQGSLSDARYAAKVWEKILGDRVGNEAKVVFSTGFLSTSEDYEFVIADWPVVDRTKDLNGVPSEWKITLYKSSAEYEATGLYIPNASSPQPQAGDCFFFIGIDMPHDYVVWAEKALNAYKTEALGDTAETSPTWAITMDKVRVHTIEEADGVMSLADRLNSGVKLRVTDPRFTGGAILSLYVQSITYTWNEPSTDSPYLVPDIEVVLSDDVVSTEGPVKTIQGQLSAIQKSYVRAYQVEEAVTRIGKAMFLRKTGEEEVSYSPTSFKSPVRGEDFRQGNVGGTGWGFYKDGDGRSVLETDKIIVRQDLEVNSLVANQISYVGGKQIISAASMEISQVVEEELAYYLYFDQKQGSIANLFKTGDIFLSQNFDATNNETRYYKGVVSQVGTDYIVVAKADMIGEDEPLVGDVLVQYGSTSDPNRRYVIIRDVIGGGYERMLSDLDSPTSDGKEYYFAGMTKEGSSEFIALKDKNDNLLYDKNNNLLGYVKYSPKHRWFVGNKDYEYAEWIDGELTVKGRIYVYDPDGGGYTYMAPIIATVNYLQSALPKDTGGVTAIAGGVVLSTIIGVQSQGDLVAGINASDLGYDSTHGTLMMFAGAVDAQNVGSAKFRVYEDGHVVANDLTAVGVDISGKITSQEGEIGSFIIGTNYLVSSLEHTSSSKVYTTDMRLSSSQIYFTEIQTSPYEITTAKVKLGSGVYPPSLGGAWAGPMSVEYTKSDDTAPYGTRSKNVGAYFDVSGSYRENFAVYANRGKYGGLRLVTELLSTANFTKNLDANSPTNFLMVQASGGTINLPSTPQDGQFYIIGVGYRSSSSYFTCTINAGTHNISSADSSTVATTREHTTHRGFDILVYDDTVTLNGVQGAWFLYLGS